MYQYKVMNEEELRIFLSKNEHEKECNENGWLRVKGFHYFEKCMPLYMDRNPEIYNFLAFQDNKMVGIFRIIGNVERPQDKEFWIDFIDVHKDHRKRGIATKLYQLFNTWVKPNPDFILIGTLLSEQGESSNLHNLRTSIVNNCNCFTTKEQLRQHKLEIYNKKNLCLA